MKHALRTFLTALAMAFVYNVTAVPIAAAQLPSAVIAVVDTQEIRRESLAGKDFSRQVEVIQQEFQAEYNQVSETLKREEAELQRQRAILSPEAFEERRAVFAERFQNAQTDLEEKQRRINLAISKANNELTRALMPIFQRIIEANGANLLLERSQIVLPAPALDITDQVVAELDKILPTVDIDTSTVNASAATATTN